MNQNKIIESGVVANQKKIELVSKLMQEDRIADKLIDLLDFKKSDEQEKKVKEAEEDIMNVLGMNSICCKLELLQPIWKDLVSMKKGYYIEVITEQGDSNGTLLTDAPIDVFQEVMDRNNSFISGPKKSHV